MAVLDAAAPPVAFACCQLFFSQLVLEAGDAKNGVDNDEKGRFIEGVDAAGGGATPR